MTAPTIAAVGAMMGGRADSNSVQAIAKPSGVVNGSLLVAVYSCEHTGSGTLLAAPSGWTKAPGSDEAFQAVSSGTASYVFYRIVTDAESEPASYDFPVEPSRWRRGAVLRIAGHDASNPFDDGDGAVAANSSSVPSTSVTTAGPDRLLLWHAVSYNLSAWPTMPTGFTELAEFASSSDVNTLAQRTVATASTVTTGSISAGTGSGKAVWLGAIRPASSVAPVTESGTLSAVVSDVYSNRTNANGDGTYDVPTTQAAADFASAFAAIMTGDSTTAAALMDPYGYDVVLFTDTSNSRQYTFLRERTPCTRFWGFYAWNREADHSDLVVEAPHPKADLNTQIEAGNLVTKANARAFLLATTHRLSLSTLDADGDNVSDVANAEDPNVFTEVHKVAHEAGTTAVQIHGFANATDPHQIVISEGQPSPGPRLLKLAEDLAASPGAFDVGVFDGTVGAALGATGNKQGQWSRAQGDRYWVHVEQNSDLRGSSTQRGYVEDVLALGIPAPTPAAPGAEFDLSRWHLTLPTPDPVDGDAEQIDWPELETYSSEYFYLDDEGRMVFVAPVEGATTSGESGATRSEKREREAGSYAQSAWNPATTGRRQLTVVCRVDGTSIDGPIDGTNGRRQEVIFFQIHGATGTPPLYLTAEWTSSGNAIATPRVRMFVSGSGLSNANLVSPITPDADIAVRCRVEDATLKLWCVLGTEEDLPAITTTPTFSAPVSAFSDTTDWYFKHGAYNKTKIGVGATGEAIVKTSFEELLQPGDPEPGSGSIEGALDATLALPVAGLAGAVRAHGELAAGTPRPTAAIAGAVADTGPLSATAPAPTSVLTGGVLLTGSIATTLPMAAVGLVGTVTSAGSVAATAILPSAQIASMVTARGELSSDVPAPSAALSATVTAPGELGAALPSPLAQLGGDSTATGPLHGALPAPVAGLAGTVTAGGALSGGLSPAIADLTGTVTVGGALDAALPVPLAALGADSSAAGPLVAVLPPPTVVVTADVVLVGQLTASLAPPVAQLLVAGRTEGELVATAPLPRAALRMREPVAHVTEVVGLSTAPVAEHIGLRSGSLTPVTGLSSGVPSRS